jgi:hypothetical protein
MPRKRTAGKARRAVAQDHLVHGLWCQLMSGFDWMFDEFGEEEAFDEQAARHAWKLYGEGLTALHIETFPGTRLWAWWKFEAPQPERPGEDERQYLGRLELLTPKEQRVLTQSNRAEAEWKRHMEECSRNWKGERNAAQSQDRQGA